MVTWRHTLPRRLLLHRLPVVTSHSTAPFSVSSHQSIRKRPSRRPVMQKPADGSLQGGNEDIEPKAFGILHTTPQTTPSPRLPHNSTSSTTQPHSHPDTSTAGPYKQILLASKLIYHQPPTINLDSAQSHITARTTKPQIQQLLAAEKFFSSRYKFLYSAETLRHHPPNSHTPEIIILGASNVGKSTFLNALVGSSTAARVSQKPGRTTLMNAFGVGPPPKIPRELVPKGTLPPRHSLVLVDTPGYGYKSQASWGDAIVKYLQNRRVLRGAVVLLSSEKKLLPEDRWMLRTLAEANTRTVVVLTKADKARGGWAEKCGLLADVVQQELDTLHLEFEGRWRDSQGPAAQTYITSAGMERPGKLGNGGGMGGVRTAILEMAGFTLQERVTKKLDTVTYSGPIVSFDDIQWKT